MLLLAVLEKSHKSITRKLHKTSKLSRKSSPTNPKIPVTQAPSVPSEPMYLPIHFSKELINGLS